MGGRSAIAPKHAPLALHLSGVEILGTARISTAITMASVASDCFGETEAAECEMPAHTNYLPLARRSF